MADTWWVGQAPAGLPRDPGAVEWTYVQAASAPSSWSNVHGPYATEAAALAELYVVTNGAAGSPSGTGNNPKTGAPAGNTNINQQTQNLKGPVPNPLSGLAAIGDFFSRLGQASTWVRVGEVLLGLVLVAVGVARITHAVPIATSVAKTAGAVALA